MDLKEIQEFIKSIVRSGATEVKLETNDFKLSVTTPNKGRGNEVVSYVQQVQPQNQVVTEYIQPTPQPLMHVAAKTEAPVAEAGEKYLTIKSPMVGTFYRRPAPNKPFFINEGDVIKKGQAIGVIEAMKLFNEIEAEIGGKVVKILVDDATPVEFDQPLMLVDPA